jgi:prepilin-type N-terminal cleavage/methylation domain-containing protein
MAGAEGMTLVELIIALSLIAIVAVGFMATTAAAFRGIAVARQRLSATQVANARLEEARYDNYAQLALPTTLVQSSDPGDPDYYVSADGSSFDVTGTGQYEPLVYDPAGVATHFQDPVQVGSVLMKVYAYVTWVNDPTAGGAHAYKRVTIVVEYKAPANGLSKMVRLSSYFTPDTVKFAPATTTTTTPSTTVPTTTTTTPATTTTTTGGTCGGGAVSGSFALGTPNGAVSGYTPSTNVTVNLTASGACTPIQARFSNNGSTWGSWVTYTGGTQQISWSVPTGDGSKTIYGQVEDSTGSTVTMTAQSITLDTTPPTTPGTLQYSMSCQGSTRNTTLSWSWSSDTNFQGYRVYRSTDGGATWQVIATTAALTASDSTTKTISSTQYKVVGYDKAGNESSPTNVLSFGKNQCS